MKIQIMSSNVVPSFTTRWQCSHSFSSLEQHAELFLYYKRQHRAAVTLWHMTFPLTSWHADFLKVEYTQHNNTHHTISALDLSHHWWVCELNLLCLAADGDYVRIRVSVCLWQFSSKQKMEKFIPCVCVVWSRVLVCFWICKWINSLVWVLFTGVQSWEKQVEDRV